jgi:hypothetical protein
MPTTPQQRPPHPNNDKPEGGILAHPSRPCPNIGNNREVGSLFFPNLNSKKSNFLDMFMGSDFKCIQNYGFLMDPVSVH